MKITHSRRTMGYSMALSVNNVLSAYDIIDSTAMTAIRGKRWVGMNWRMRDVTILKMNGLIIGISLLATMPVFCNLLFAYPASALSPLGLVRDTSMQLKEVVLGNEGNVTPSTQATPQPARSQSTTSPHSSSAVSSPMAANQSSPAVVYGAPLDLVNPIEIDPLHEDGAHQPSVQLASAGPRNSLSSNSYSSAIPLLQPTDQGWKILGVLWYWWVIGGVIAAAGVRFSMKLATRRGAQLPLVS
ncbi:MAG: hypothetical protein ACHQTE_01075 [Candidatus Saccharimonadales bacterium]